MSSFAHLRHGPRDAVCSPSPIHSGVCRLSDKVHVCAESFKESCFFFFSFFSQQGSLYLSHQSYMTFCWAPLSNGCVNRLTPRRWTRWTINRRAHSPRRRITDECGRFIIFHHLFLMRRVGGTRMEWIFMNLQRAYMYHSDFHPCHQAMQIASSHLRMADAALINGTVKMFPLARKLSSFKRERPRDINRRGLLSSAVYWPKHHLNLLPVLSLN